MREPRALKRLPRSLDDIRGLRVARWIRESTAGQYDGYEPASQREQQDRIIDRKAAAHRLGLSHSTVKHHLANARSKVGATTTAQLEWNARAAAAGA